MFTNLEKMNILCIFFMFANIFRYIADIFAGIAEKMFLEPSPIFCREYTFFRMPHETRDPIG